MSLLCFSTFQLAIAQSSNFNQYTKFFDYIDRLDEARSKNDLISETNDRLVELLSNRIQKNEAYSELSKAAKEATKYRFPANPNWNAYSQSISRFNPEERYALPRSQEGLVEFEGVILNAQITSEELFKVTRKWRTIRNRVEKIRDDFKILMSLPDNEFTHTFTNAWSELDVVLIPAISTTLSAYEGADRKFAKDSIEFSKKHLPRLQSTHTVLENIQKLTESDYNAITGVVADAKDMHQKSGELLVQASERLKNEIELLEKYERTILKIEGAPNRIVSLEESIKSLRHKIADNNAIINGAYNLCPEGNPIDKCTSQEHQKYRYKWVYGMNDARDRNRKLKRTLSNKLKALSKERKLIKQLDDYQKKNEQIKSNIPVLKDKIELRKKEHHDFQENYATTQMESLWDIQYLDRLMIDVREDMARVEILMSEIQSFEHVLEKPLNRSIFKSRDTE